MNKFFMVIFAVGWLILIPLLLRRVHFASRAAPIIGSLVVVLAMALFVVVVFRTRAA